jgi:hypothetical protein
MAILVNRDYGLILPVHFSLMAWEAIMDRRLLIQFNEAYESIAEVKCGGIIDRCGE